MAQPTPRAADLALPSRRQQLAPLLQQLREIRDEIERINDPYDPDLGVLHVRLSIVTNDLSAKAAASPVFLTPELVDAAARELRDRRPGEVIRI